MNIPAELYSEVENRIFRPIPPAISFLTDELVAKYGQATEAVLFYGSCLQHGNPYDGIVDIYILVDHYRHAYDRGIAAVANYILPPNVYYHETMFHGRTIRTKYAVISMEQFQKACTMQWFHSYFWGRFCQPSLVAFTAHDQAKKIIVNTVATSILTFLARTVPCICEGNDGELTWERLWHEGLQMSYSAELRPERADRTERILKAGSTWFKAVTLPALQALPFQVAWHECGTIRYASIPRKLSIKCRISWVVRRVQGKCLSVMRLAKASFTFKGGVDYIVWKIERHSGVKIEVTPFLRRHPVLAMIALAWRIFSRGAAR
jgi:hypothetical protein